MQVTHVVAHVESHYAMAPKPLHLAAKRNCVSFAPEQRQRVPVTERHTVWTRIIASHHPECLPVLGPAINKPVESPTHWLGDFRRTTVWQLRPRGVGGLRGLHAGNLSTVTSLSLHKASCLPATTDSLRLGR